MEREILISETKIKINLKKYWYILLFTLLIGSVLGICLNKHVKNTKKELKYYQAVVDFSIHWDEIAQKEEELIVRLNLINSLDVYMKSNDIIEELNKRLLNQKYEALGDNDSYELTIETDQYMSLLVNGVNDYERTKYIGDQLTDILLSRLELKKNELQYEKMGDLVIYEARKIDSGALVKTNKKAQQEDDVVSNGYTTMLLFVIAGLVVGFGIIIVLTIRDPYIHSYTDVPIELTYLGHITANNQNDENELILKVLTNRCKKNNIKKLVILGIDNVLLESVVNQIKENEQDIKAFNYAESKYRNDDLCEIMDADGIILVITAGHNKITELISLKNVLDVAQCNVLGYVLQMTI